jgi:two-component system, NarL family, response regulator YdfI
MSRKNGAGAIRVLVVALSSVRRAGLEALVRTSAPLKLAGSTPSLAVIRLQAREFQPDIILADLDRADPQFVTTISALTESAENIGAVALVDNPNPGWIARSLRAGVKAVLPRDAPAQQILSTVQMVYSGLVVLDSRTTIELAQRVQLASTDSPREAFDALTAREVQVLRMLAEGLGNREMAVSLGISEHTVKFHISSIFDKLGASTRTEAVTLGVRMGLILL